MSAAQVEESTSIATEDVIEPCDVALEPESHTVNSDDQETTVRVSAAQVEDSVSVTKGGTVDDVEPRDVALEPEAHTKP